MAHRDTRQRRELSPVLEVDRAWSTGGGGEVTLNEARANVGVALSNLIHSQPTQEKIDKAKSAIQAWIQELEAAKP
jgi:hypothetical protein